MYKDLGYKIGGPVEASPMKEEPRISYPSLCLNSDSAPDIKADEVFEATVKLKFKGFRKDDYSKDRPYHLDFDVMAIDFGKGGPDIDESDEEEEGLQSKLEKELSDKMESKKKGK